jgi:hypothetical protein
MIYCKWDDYGAKVGYSSVLQKEFVGKKTAHYLCTIKTTQFQHKN